MKNDAYMPYNFNIEYEYLTYKNIGVEEKILYKAKRNTFYRLRLLIRKFFNKNERKYKNLNKYSEWEEYVKNTSVADILNKKDFIHFLEAKARYYDVIRHTVGTILTPIFVVILSGALTIFLSPFQGDILPDVILFSWLSFIVILYIVLIYLNQSNNYRNNRYFFCKDYIKIIEEQEQEQEQEKEKEKEQSNKNINH